MIYDIIKSFFTKDKETLKAIAACFLFGLYLSFTYHANNYGLKFFKDWSNLLDWILFAIFFGSSFFALFLVGYVVLIFMQVKLTEWRLKLHDKRMQRWQNDSIKGKNPIQIETDAEVVEIIEQIDENNTMVVVKFDRGEAMAVFKQKVSKGDKVRIRCQTKFPYKVTLVEEDEEKPNEVEKKE